MPNISIFSDEWRECLRAHFTTVIRNNDKITERTLRSVMFEAGFTDAELKELAVRATMRVEDVDADFVPDMDILEAEPPAEASGEIFTVPAIAVPQEVIEAALVEESIEMDEAIAAADATQSDAEMDESELETEGDTESDEPPPAPDVTQLSLF